MTDAMAVLAEELIGLDHIGVAVADLDEAIARHTSLFGLVLSHREVNAEQQVEEAMLSIPGGDVELQLLAATSSDSPIAKFIEKRGAGLQQIAYRVRSVSRCTELLALAGIETLYSEPRIGTAGSKINFIHPRATGGVLVELVERA